MTDLKSLAGDLDSFLRDVQTRKATTPSPAVEQTQQRLPSPAAQPKPQDEQTKTSPDKLVRAVWDYVSSRMEEDDSARTIGETFMVAVAATSRDAGVDLNAMNSAAIDFLESIVEAARSSL